MTTGIIVSIASAVICGGVGGFAGFFIAKKKYEKQITKEVEAVEAYYKKNQPMHKKTDISKPVTKQTKIPVDKNSLDLNSSKEPNTTKNYGGYFGEYSGTKTPEKFDPNKPYIISEEEYAESEYDNRTLLIFDDGVLTDDDYNIVEDISGLVGNEVVNIMMSNKNSSDAMYVRNEKYKVDYEILRDLHTYKEASPFHTSVAYSEAD